MAKTSTSVNVFIDVNSASREDMLEMTGSIFYPLSALLAAIREIANYFWAIVFRKNAW